MWDGARPKAERRSHRGGRGRHRAHGHVAPVLGRLDPGGPRLSAGDAPHGRHSHRPLDPHDRFQLAASVTRHAHCFLGRSTFPGAGCAIGAEPQPQYVYADRVGNRRGLRLQPGDAHRAVRWGRAHRTRGTSASINTRYARRPIFISRPLRRSRSSCCSDRFSRSAHGGRRRARFASCWHSPHRLRAVSSTNRKSKSPSPKFVPATCSACGRATRFRSTDGSRQARRRSTNR